MYGVGVMDRERSRGPIRPLASIRPPTAAADVKNSYASSQHTAAQTRGSYSKMVSSNVSRTESYSTSNVVLSAVASAQSVSAEDAVIRKHVSTDTVEPLAEAEQSNVESLAVVDEGDDNVPATHARRLDDTDSFSHPVGVTRVVVAVRVRPLCDMEHKAGAVSVVSIEGDSISVMDPVAMEIGALVQQPAASVPKRNFSFDHVYSNAKQDKIFKDLGLRVVDHAFSGYNSSVFAYGQTGSGKSYTMLGSSTVLDPYSEDVGLIPRICRKLFKRMEKRNQEALPGTHYTHTVTASYLEIYCEKIRDLFAIPDAAAVKGVAANKPIQGLKIREHPTEGVYVPGLKEIPVSSYADIEKLLMAGSYMRTVAETRMNEASSRSHAVFTLHFSETLVESSSETPISAITSKIVLVDLAGSERSESIATAPKSAYPDMTAEERRQYIIDPSLYEKQKGTEAAIRMQRQKEMNKINTSLSTLGVVIKALSSQTTTGAAAFVPYRNSTLTWLLKDCLGGNSATTMIATVSPADSNYLETVSTLKYCESVKLITTQATKNTHVQVGSDPEAALRAQAALIERLSAEVSQLQAQLKQGVRGSDTIASPTLPRMTRVRESAAIRDTPEKVLDGATTMMHELGMRVPHASAAMSSPGSLLRMAISSPPPHVTRQQYKPVAKDSWCFVALSKYEMLHGRIGLHFVEGTNNLYFADKVADSLGLRVWHEGEDITPSSAVTPCAVIVDGETVVVAPNNVENAAILVNGKPVHEKTALLSGDLLFVLHAKVVAIFQVCWLSRDAPVLMGSHGAITLKQAISCKSWMSAAQDVLATSEVHAHFSSTSSAVHSTVVADLEKLSLQHKLAQEEVTALKGQLVVEQHRNDHLQALVAIDKEAHSEYVTRLQMDLDAVRNNYATLVEKLRREVDSAASNASIWEAKYNDTLTRAEQAERDCETLTATNAATQEEITSLRAAHHTAQQQLAETKEELQRQYLTVQRVMERDSSLQDACKGLHVEVAQLRAELVMLQTAKQQAATTSTELIAEIQSIESAKSEMQIRLRESEDELQLQQAQNQKLTEVLSHVQAQLKDAIAARDAKYQETAAQAENLMAANNCISELQIQVKALQQQVLVAQQANAQYEDEKAHAEIIMTGLRQQLEATKQQLNTRNESHAETHEGLRRENAALQTQVTTLTTEIQTLRHTCGSHTTQLLQVEADLAEMTAAMHAITAERDALSKMLHQARQQLQNSESAAEESAQQLQQEKSRLQDMINDRDNQLQTLQKRIDTQEALLNAANTQLSEETSHHLEQLNASRMELSTVQAQVSHYHTQLTEMTARYSEATTQVSQLQKQVSEYRSQLTEVSTQLEMVQTQLAETTHQYTFTAQQLSEARIHQATTQTRILQLETELHDSKKRFTDTSADISQLSNDNSELRTALHATTAKYDAAMAHITHLTSELANVTTQYTHTSTQLAAEATQLTSLTKQLAESEFQLSLTTSQLKDAQTQVTELTTQLTESQSLHSAATQQVTELQAQLKNTTAHLTAAAREQHAHATAEIAQLQNQLVEKQAQLATASRQATELQTQLTQTIQQLSAKHSDATTELTAMTAQHKAAMQEISQLRSQLVTVTAQHKEVSQQLAEAHTRMSTTATEHTAEATDLRAQLKDAASQLAALRAEQEALQQSHGAQLAFFHDKLRRAEDEMERLRTTGQQIRDKAGAVEAELSRRMQDMSALQADFQAYRTQAEQAHRDVAEAMRGEYKTKFKALEAEYGSKYESMEAEYTAKLQGLQAEYDVKCEEMKAAFNAKYKQLEANYVEKQQMTEAEFAQRLRDAEAAGASKLSTVEVDYSTKYRVLEADYTAKLVDLEKTHAQQMERLRCSLTELETRYRTQTSHLEETTRVLQQEKLVVIDLRSVVTRMEAQTATLQTQCESISSALQEANASIIEKDAKLAQFSVRLAEKEAKVLELAGLLDTTCCSLDAAVKASEDARLESHRSEDAAASQSRSVASLQAALEKLQRSNVELSRQLTTRTLQVANAEAEVGRLSALLADLQRENKQVSHEVDQLNAVSTVIHKLQGDVRAVCRKGFVDFLRSVAADETVARIKACETWLNRLSGAVRTLAAAYDASTKLQKKWEAQAHSAEEELHAWRLQCVELATSLNIPGAATKPLALRDVAAVVLSKMQESRTVAEKETQQYQKAWMTKQINEVQQLTEDKNMLQRRHDAMRMEFEAYKAKMGRQLAGFAQTVKQLRTGTAKLRSHQQHMTEVHNDALVTVNKQLQIAQAAVLSQLHTQDRKLSETLLQLHTVEMRGSEAVHTKEHLESEFAIVRSTTDAALAKEKAARKDAEAQLAAANARCALLQQELHERLQDISMFQQETARLSSQSQENQTFVTSLQRDIQTILELHTEEKDKLVEQIEQMASLIREQDVLLSDNSPEQLRRALSESEMRVNMLTHTLQQRTQQLAASQTRLTHTVAALQDLHMQVQVMKSGQRGIVASLKQELQAVWMAFESVRPLTQAMQESVTLQSKTVSVMQERAKSMRGEMERLSRMVEVQALQLKTESAHAEAAAASLRECFEAVQHVTTGITGALQTDKPADNSWETRLSKLVPAESVEALRTAITSAKEGASAVSANNNSSSVGKDARKPLRDLRTNSNASNVVMLSPPPAPPSLDNMDLGGKSSMPFDMPEVFSRRFGEKNAGKAKGGANFVSPGAKPWTSGTSSLSHFFDSPPPAANKTDIPASPIAVDPSITAQLHRVQSVSSRLGFNVTTMDIAVQQVQTALDVHRRMR